MYDLTSEELTRNAQTLLFILKNIPQKERCYISPSLSIYFSVFYVPNTHFSIFICWMLIHLQSMGFLLKLVFLSSGSELEEDASSDQRASNQHEKYWLLALQISILISGQEKEFKTTTLYAIMPTSQKFYFIKILGETNQ